MTHTQAPDAAEVVKAGADDAGSTACQEGRAVDSESAYEARMREGRERADRYLAELVEEIGEPSPEAVAEAEAMWSRIERALNKARAAE